MTASPADRLKGKQPRRITVGVFLDEGPADRLDAAVIAVQDARRVGAPAEDITALEKSVTEAQQGLDDVTFWFTFQGIGRGAFARLLAEYPPTPEQEARAEADGRDRPEYDTEAFPAALLQAACIAPQLPPGHFAGLFDDDAWNDAELGSLCAAALAVNTRSRPLRVRAGT